MWGVCLVELIVSHNNTDFDGLACMIAASKLYPVAVMVFEGKPTRQVREFLALHKDALPILDIKTIDLTKVTRVILVDTRSSSRIGSIAKLISKEDMEIHIYDHHPQNSDDLCGQLELVENVGAATTLMVETLQHHKLNISSFEATLLALGIFEDTGNLLFEGTTARDAKALAFLLENGANLKIVGEFIERPLSKEQKSLLNTLLTSARHYLIKGTKVLLTTATIDQFVAGLALLTFRVSEIENLDVIFSVVKMDDRVHIVARGKGRNLAVNEVLREFGGGGHPAAASATVKNGDVNQITKRLLELLEELIVPEITARTIMSSAVRSIPSRSSMQDAAVMLLRYGYTGMPVVDDGKLVGIISRRDVDKALNHGLGHAPVTGYMSRQVKTITMDATLNEIENIMIQHDIGRLPVVSEDTLVGIVSRSDVLRSLHGQAIPVSHQIMRQRSRVQGEMILQLMAELPQDIRDLLHLVASLSTQQQCKVYVVGGFVRDLLLGVPNFDVDFVVEGDGVQFAKVLAEKLQAKARSHRQFGTASISTTSGLNLDVVTARWEYYDFPASLPEVERSSLKDDLYRRDFTLNAMAIALNEDEFGRLEDYYGGYRDLQQGELRILHNLSFVDDPKRILRAIRFEQRLRFRLEAQTAQMLQRAVAEHRLEQLSRDRLKDEFILMLMEPDSYKVFSRLANLGAWDQVLPEIPWVNEPKLFLKVKDAVILLTETGLTHNINLWLVNLMVLFAAAEPVKAAEVLANMHFEGRIVSMVTEYLQHSSSLRTSLQTAGIIRRSQIHDLLAKSSVEVVAALLSDSDLFEILKDYLLFRSRVKVYITGKDLKALNIQPGPVYAKLLAALWRARLDDLVHDRDDELRLVKTMIGEV